MSNIKDKIYNWLVRKNADVQYEYERYVMENMKEHYENHLKHIRILLKLKWHYQIKGKKNRLLFFDEFKENKLQENNENEKYEKKLYFENEYTRLNVEKFVAELVEYDVISFDIFDTLIYRKVEKPNDIFVIMSAEMGRNDFVDIRKKAENFARNIKEKREGTREIILQEIYLILEERFAIDPIWMKREIELEINMSMPNKYMLQVYELLLKFEKTIIFTTDMYLPLEVIKKLVQKNGYYTYDQIFLSNEYGVRKGDGTLQKILIEKYPQRKIVHIGDNYEADFKKSLEAGIDAIYNPDSHFIYREPELENLAASIYRAVIQTNMNNGLWDKSLYYSHGYRVGGILAVGYCKFIERVVNRKHIDKILFCSRDCDVVYKLYNQLYNDVRTEYINISRYAIFNITSEHYLYDLSNRYIMHFIKMYSNSKTIATILEETGYGYLVNELEKYNIDRFQFPAAIKDYDRIQEFIYKCSSIIFEHNSESRKAAAQYYTETIGTSENILIVDIGWSGTCITALKYFIQKYVEGFKGNLFGALMATNRNEHIKNSIQFGEIEAYLNTPFHNMDITRYIFPGPPKSRNVIELDKIHMPFEYLFTSTKSSILGYKFEQDGSIGFVYSKNCIPNCEQIEEMQKGIIDFAKSYMEYSENISFEFLIPPYTAFLPIKECINHEKYSYEVYKDFLYDAASPIETDIQVPVFADLFKEKFQKKSTMKAGINGKKILFISPEMTYSGTPRSLLRMCRVAINLGYSIMVWTAKDGPFINEFGKDGIPVEVVSEKRIGEKHTIDRINQFDLVICNTVVTSEYVSVCCREIPTVWYIREATNIPDFIRSNPERAYVIKHSLDIYVVSDYAAEALSLYTDEPVHVVHNCVEDEADMAVSYLSGTADKVKFVQFGTMEYRKGYDVLLAAYKAMPDSYREKAELYFAGGYINSGTAFCSYLFREMENMKNVHYLGLVKGEENKIQTLSQMDVVVVASRDESCSLVALEGAMLSKPLIVTENVGAKYIVNEASGYIVKTGNVESLKIAMMQMIDSKDDLAKMGEASRTNYEKMAGMEAYTKKMRDIYALADTKGSDKFIERRERNREIFSENYKAAHPLKIEKSKEELAELNDIVIVSLTSHPGRIDIVDKTIETLINQTVRPKKIALWLSEEEFPYKDNELPRDLIVKRNTCDLLEINWVKDDLKPHKKYLYAMKQYQDEPIIIVDDDVYYDKHLIEYLLDSYIKFPNCISAMRTNLIGFKRDGSFMGYEGWIKEYRILQDVPSTQLMPTGVGGVLYPPHALPEETFDIQVIKDTCLYCDDLWLKVWACHAGLKTVMPERFCIERLIENSQDAALWKINVKQQINNNDVSFTKILNYYDAKTGNLDRLISWIRKDMFC